MRSACAARACAFGNSVYNRRSSVANFMLMMGMVMFQYDTSGLNVPPPVKNVTIRHFVKCIIPILF
jgi:hypothetical protein